MRMRKDSQTHPSLLERLRNGEDGQSWYDFYQRYGRAMYAFAKRCGCSDSTAEDIIQEVMITLFEKRHLFRYDPTRGRFSNWLYTVVRQKVALCRRQQARQAKPAGGDSHAADPPGIDHGAPETLWYEAFERALLTVLLDIVRREVAPATYQAFELSTLHELPGAEVARITGLTRNAVYLACRRVMRRLCDLGAPYRNQGELGTLVRDALRQCPGPAVEQKMATRIESAVGRSQEGPT